MAKRKSTLLDSTRPRMTVHRPDSAVDPTEKIKDLYSKGRQYPGKRQHENSYGDAVKTPQWPGWKAGHHASGEAGLGNQEDPVDPLSPYCELPQAVEDRRGPGYFNDVPDGWLRGYNASNTKATVEHELGGYFPDATKSDATHKPFFDHSKGKYGQAKPMSTREGITAGTPGHMLPHESHPARYNAPPQKNDHSMGGVPGHKLYDMKQHGPHFATARVAEEEGEGRSKGMNIGRGKGTSPFSAAYRKGLGEGY